MSQYLNQMGYESHMVGKVLQLVSKRLQTLDTNSWLTLRKPILVTKYVLTALLKIIFSLCPAALLNCEIQVS